MLVFFRISGDRKGCYGIHFTSTLLFGPLVLSHLEEFHLMLFNSIGFQFVIQKFEIVGGYLCIWFLYSGVSSLTLIRICIFKGKTSHPSLVPLLLLIYILFLIK